MVTYILGKSEKSITERKTDSYKQRVPARSRKISSFLHVQLVFMNVQDAFCFPEFLLFYRIIVYFFTSTPFLITLFLCL